MRDAARGPARARARRRLARGAHLVAARDAGVMAKRVWLVLPDPFPTRVFVDCGIVAGLADELPGAVEVVLALPEDEARSWAPRLGTVPWLLGADLFPREVGTVERVQRRIDLALDRNVGYYPLSVRHSLRHGLNRERMRPGHPNLFLDSSLTGRLPESERLDALVAALALLAAPLRPRALVASACATRARALVVANVQSLQAVPFLDRRPAARAPDRRLRRELGPHGRQGNRLAARRPLRRPERRDARDLSASTRFRASASSSRAGRRRTSSTCARPRECVRRDRREPRARSRAAVVLVAGNTPTNAPYEGRFVERLVELAASEAARSARPQLLFRPHPRDTEWRERFAAALGAEDAAVQEPSYTDLETLATLLQHVDCVVANAGTILLDSLVNDRPAVCVLYDEGAPAARAACGAERDRRALRRAHPLRRVPPGEQLRRGRRRASSGRSPDPTELAAERRRVAEEVVGEVDGRAADEWSTRSLEVLR